MRFKDIRASEQIIMSFISFGLKDKIYCPAGIISGVCLLFNEILNE